MPPEWHWNAFREGIMRRFIYAWWRILHTLNLFSWNNPNPVLKTIHSRQVLQYVQHLMDGVIFQRLAPTEPTLGVCVFIPQTEQLTSEKFDSWTALEYKRPHTMLALCAPTALNMTHSIECWTYCSIRCKCIVFGAGLELFQLQKVSVCTKI